MGAARSAVVGGAGSGAAVSVAGTGALEHSRDKSMEIVGLKVRNVFSRPANCGLCMVRVRGFVGAQRFLWGTDSRRDI